MLVLNARVEGLPCPLVRALGERPQHISTQPALPPYWKCPDHRDHNAIRAR